MEYRCGRFHHFKTQRQLSTSCPKDAVVVNKPKIFPQACREVVPPQPSLFYALLRHGCEIILKLKCLIICQGEEPLTRPQQPSSSRQGSYLYSSDEEEDTDEESFGIDSQLDLIREEEIPFVRLFDRIISFCDLWTSNFPLLAHEVLANAHDWGRAPDDQGIRNTAFFVTPKRPEIINAAVRVLKRRELRRRMTRIGSEEEQKKWLLRWALGSRASIFVIQAIVINMFDAFKHNNDGFKFTPEEDYGKLLDPLINSTFGGYVNWDAHYFLHISVNGYSAENFLAFFPLLPMILYVPSRILYFLVGFFVSLSSIITVLAVLLNTWLFVKCAENVYELTKMWSKGSQQLITAAVLFFSFNPASIFFTGLYTETLFAYLTSQVILSLFRREYLASMFFAGLSGLCRSNGILNIGFIAAFTLQQMLLNEKSPFKFLVFVGSSIFQGFACLTPFLLFQAYAVMTFCGGQSPDDVVVDLDQIPLYCVGSSKLSFSTLPYSYVQKKYWNVGFLRYFRVKQIPNFILAFPVLYILGKESTIALKQSYLQMKSSLSWSGLYFGAQALHGIFMTLFCFFFVHVQVSTRMIMAACPYLYLYMADSYVSDIERFRGNEISVPIRSQLLMLWCALYFIIGTIGFSLGLPWT